MKRYDVSRLPSMIELGYAGENNWRPNRFDCSALLKNHPNGVITLWLLPQGESQAFPVALERDGNTVIWTPLSEEMTAETGAGVALDNASSPKSTSTLCGALRYSIERILAAYPNIFIFVSLPIYRMWDSVGAETYTNSQNKTLYEYAEAMAEVSKSYGCPVIDGLHDLGFNKVNFPTFASDKTHLSAVSGRKRFGYLIGGELDSKG